LRLKEVVARYRYDENNRFPIPVMEEESMCHLAGCALKQAVSAIWGLTSLEFDTVDIVHEGLLGHDDLDHSPWTNLR
jgi:hypothetical protein